MAAYFAWKRLPGFASETQVRVALARPSFLSRASEKVTTVIKVLSISARISRELCFLCKVNVSSVLFSW